MTLCDGCKNHLPTWSEDLRKEWRGCTILLLENIKIDSNQQILENIIA